MWTSGSFLRGALSWFIITGSFACEMVFHNTSAQYMYALGRERVLPQALGRPHANYHSARVASTMQLVITAVILLAFVLFATVDFLSSGYSYAKWLCRGDVLIFLVGLGYAFYLKANDRDRYRDGRPDDQTGGRQGVTQVRPGADPRPDAAPDTVRRWAPPRATCA